MQVMHIRGEVEDCPTQAFYERIRHHYLKLAKSYPNRIAVIDADQSIDKVALALQAAMQKRLPELIA